MPDLALDLRYLRYAMLVAEHGSFRRVADSLNISQSTISRRIRLLEHRLGVTLFERSRTGARLSTMGAWFLREAAVSAEDLRQAINGVALAQSGEIGELRIGVVGSLSSGPLATLLAEYHRRFPKVILRVEETGSETSAAGVFNGRLDLAFVLGRPKSTACNTEALWDEFLYVALPMHHHLAGASHLDWPQLQHEHFLVTADGCGPVFEDYIVRHLARPNFRPRILVQSVGRDNLRHLVSGGLGIALTTASTLGLSSSSAECRFVRIGDEALELSVLWRQTNHNPALKGLLAVTTARASVAVRETPRCDPPRRSHLNG